MSSRSSSSSSSAPDKCRSPAGLEEERCSCCLDLANRRRLDWSCWRSLRRRGCSGGTGTGTTSGGSGGEESDESPAVSPGIVGNLNVDGTGRFLCQEQDSPPEPAVRSPDPLLRPRQTLRDRAVDQTLLSILLFFHSASGASVVAIDNKIEQAMDLVKNHLMYAVREEVEVLKEQIKELAEKNSQLEWENSLLKNMASPEQLQKFQSHLPVEDEPPSPMATTAPEKPPSGSLGAAAPAHHPLGSAV